MRRRPADFEHLARTLVRPLSRVVPREGDPRHGRPGQVAGAPLGSREGQTARIAPRPPAPGVRPAGTPGPGPGWAPQQRGSRGSRLGRRAPSARGTQTGERRGRPRAAERRPRAARRGRPCAAPRGAYLRRAPPAPRSPGPALGTRGSEPGALWTGPGRARTAAARAAGMLRPPPALAPGGRRGPPPRGGSCSPSRVTRAPTSRARPFVRTQRRTLIFFFPGGTVFTPAPPPSPVTPHRTRAPLRTAFSPHTTLSRLSLIHSCIRGCQYSLESFIESQKAIREALLLGFRRCHGAF